MPCEAVNLIPAAFDPKNPNATANIARAEAAAKRLQDVVSQKARFLDELVRDHFGGIDNMIKALININRASSIQERNDLRAVVHEYEALCLEHDAASNALHGSFAGVRVGKPIAPPAAPPAE